MLSDGVIFLQFKLEKLEFQSVPHFPRKFGSQNASLSLTNEILDNLLHLITSSIHSIIVLIHVNDQSHSQIRNQLCKSKAEPKSQSIFKNNVSTPWVFKGQMYIHGTKEFWIRWDWSMKSNSMTAFSCDKACIVRVILHHRPFFYKWRLGLATFFLFTLSIN